MLLTALAPIATAEGVPLTVELRLEKVIAREAMTGKATFSWGNQTKALPFGLAPGEALALSQAFRDAPVDAPQGVTLTDASGAVLLEVGTTLQGGSLRLNNASVDTTRILLGANESSYRVVTGGVTGDFNVTVDYRGDASRAASRATLTIDQDGDGTLSADEARDLVSNGSAASVSVHMTNVPATSQWALSVVHNGTPLLMESGAYDWADGRFLGLSPAGSADDKEIVQVLEGVELTPTRASISGVQAVPNAMILKEIVASAEMAARPKTTLHLGWGDPEAPIQKAGGDIPLSPATPEDPPVGPQGNALGALRLWLPIGIGLVALAVTSIGVGATLARRRRENDKRRIAFDR